MGHEEAGAVHGEVVLVEEGEGVGARNARCAPLGRRVAHQVPEGKEVHARVRLGQPRLHFRYGLPLRPASAVGNLTGAPRSFLDAINARPSCFSFSCCYSSSSILSFVSSS